jgi:hypothetical protein
MPPQPQAPLPQPAPSAPQMPPGIPPGAPAAPPQGLGNEMPPDGSDPMAQAMQGAQDQQDATPEQIQMLHHMIDEMKGKLAETNSSSIAEANMQAQESSKVLREILQMLQDSGVDVGDPTAINTYIESLRSQDPEAADIFEQIMHQLIDEKDASYQRLQDKVASHAGEQPTNEISNAQPTDSVPPPQQAV